MSTPESQFTGSIGDFAKRVREKYPRDYDDVPDEVLVDRIVAKYPDYKSAVKLPDFDAPVTNQWGAARSYGGHTGVDVGYGRGERVGVPLPGRVTFAGERSGYGNRVEVDHGNGIITTYSHLDGFDVNEGDEITPDRPLGRVGNSGGNYRPHLHFEVLRDGQKVNAADTPYRPRRITSSPAQPPAPTPPSQDEAVGAFPTTPAGPPTPSIMARPPQPNVTSKVLTAEEEEAALNPPLAEPRLAPYDPDAGLSLPAGFARKAHRITQAPAGYDEGVSAPVTATLPAQGATPTGELIPPGRSELVDALMGQLGPGWRELGQRYREETGREPMSALSLPEPTRVWNADAKRWEWQASVSPTRDFIDTMKAYRGGGLEAAERVATERAAAKTEGLNRAAAEERETPYSGRVARDLATGLGRTAQGTAQLAENLRKINRGAAFADKNQRAIDEARAGMPAYKTGLGGVGGTVIEVVGDVARMQASPFGPVVEQFFENINRGGYEAAKAAGTIAALQAVGVGGDKISRLMELTPAQRQVFVRALQGEVNAIQAAAQGDPELLKAFGIGAAFPVGKGYGVAPRDPVAPRIAPTERTARRSYLDMPDVPVSIIPAPRLVRRAESPSVEPGVAEAAPTPETSLQPPQASAPPVTETIIRHSDARIDGGRVLGETSDGRLRVENNEGGVSVVKHPRRGGNREAALVRREVTSEGVSDQTVAEVATAQVGQADTAGARTSTQGDVAVAVRGAERGETRPADALSPRTETSTAPLRAESLSARPESGTAPAGRADAAAGGGLSGVSANRLAAPPVTEQLSGVRPVLGGALVGGRHEVADALLGSRVGAEALREVPAGSQLVGYDHRNFDFRTPSGEVVRVGAAYGAPAGAKVYGGRGGFAVSRPAEPLPMPGRREGVNATVQPANVPDAQPVGVGATAGLDVARPDALPEAGQGARGGGAARAAAEPPADARPDNGAAQPVLDRLSASEPVSPYTDAELAALQAETRELEPKLYTASGEPRKRVADADRARWEELKAADRRVREYREAKYQYGQAREAESRRGETLAAMREAGVREGDRVSYTFPNGERAEGVLRLDDAGRFSIGDSHGYGASAMRAKGFAKETPRAESAPVTPPARPAGRTPAEDFSAFRPAQSEPRAPSLAERSFPKSAEAAGLSKATNTVYEVQADADALARANRRIASEGADRVAADIARNAEPSKDDVVAAQLLAKRYSEAGDHAREVAVINDLAEKLTKAGQSVQAASLISRLSPEGVLIQGQRILNKRGANRTLTAEEATGLKETAAKLREAEAKASDLQRQIEEMRLRPQSVGRQGTRQKIETIVERLGKAEAEARARLEARKQAAISGSQAGASVIPLDIADYAIIGAAKLAKGTLNRGLWAGEMVKEFGEGIRPHLADIRRESVRVYREHKDGENYDRLVARVTEGEPENFTPEQIRELVQADREAARLTAKERVALRSEYLQSLGPRQGPKRGEATEPMAGPRLTEAPKPGPRMSEAKREGPKLSEAVGRAEGPRVTEAPAYGPRLSEGLKAGPSPARVLTEIAGRSQGNPQLMTGAAKFARPGMDVQTWAAEMAAEFGLEGKALRQAYRDSYALYKEANKSVYEAARTLDVQRQEAQKAAQAARRELERAFNSLSRTTTQKALDTGTSLRRANLLTAARTHLRNVTSNAMFQVTEELSRPLAAVGDMIAKRKTGVRTTRGLDIPAAVRAAIRAAITEGPARARDIMLGREVLPLEGYRPGAESAASKMQLYDSETGVRILDAYVNTVYRSLSAEDAVFKVYAFRRELADLAKSQALAERAADPTVNARARARELRQNPTEAMLTEASAYADYATFQNQNVVSEAIAAGKRKVGAAGKFVIESVAPFDRTPTNIIARTLENSPAGFISAARKYRRIGQKAAAEELAGRIADEAFTRAEQRDFARTFGRASTGTILSALGMILAHKDLLSGASDYDTDKADYMEKRRKFGGGGMLRVPGTNQRISIIDTPAGKAMATAAGIYEQMTKKATADEKATGSARLAANVLTDQPLVRAFREMGESKSVGEGVGNYLSSYVPGSAALKAGSEVLDEKPRLYRGQGVASPFRMLLPPQIPFGRGALPVDTGPALSERGGLGRRTLRALDPFNTTTEGRGPQKREKKK